MKALRNQNFIPLPIDTHLPSILEQLERVNVLLLTATPGAGKTTRIPPALLEKYKRILVIEPRRIACVASASRIAEENAFQLGQEVGYEVRFEKKASAATQILFMTDGLFLKKLMNPKELEKYDVIVLDEFHERSWAYDLILGILKENLELGSSLKLLLMSATFSSEKLLDFFKIGDLKTEFHEVIGQVFPLQIQHQKKSYALITNDAFFDNVFAAVQQALAAPTQSILVFLPGSYEIQRCARHLSAQHPRVLIQQLHGQLDLQEQKNVITYSGKERRLILATNIAESSLTIQNVDAVIDSGLQRISDFKARSGLTELALEKISLFSARQRAGRSARTKSGICFRLWNEMDERSFIEETPPEILRMDLSEALLFLSDAGLRNFENFYWLDRPELISLGKFAERLKKQALLSPTNEITKLGQRVLSFPLNIDRAMILLESENMGHAELGALLVAFLEERGTENIADPQLQSDITPLLEHGELNFRQKKVYQQILNLLKNQNRKPWSDEDLSRILLRALPQHLCLRREKKQFAGETLFGPWG